MSPHTQQCKATYPKLESHTGNEYDYAKYLRQKQEHSLINFPVHYYLDFMEIDFLA